MKLANRIKTTNNKVIFAIVAAIALSLVFLQMPIFNHAQQARADAAAEVSAQAEKTGSVDVKFSFDHAFVIYDGQQIAPPATKVTLPLDSDLVFAAEADSGYEIETVEAVVNGTKTNLKPNGSGEYKISADALQDGKTKVSVTAVSVVEESEGEVYQGDVALDEPAVDEAVEATETGAADIDKSMAVEERNEQEEFVYSDDNVTVTAKLSKPEALPAGAQLVVTPVTDKTEGYNYDAYMAALNKQAADGFQYTSENTLLFDVAFMIPKIDGNGNAIEGEFVEAQLEDGDVAIKVDFKKKQLTKGLNAKSNSDIEIKHLPLVDSARDAVESTSAATDITVDDIVVEGVEKAKVKSNEVSFKVDSLSVFTATSFAAEEAVVEVSLLDENGNVAAASDLQGTYYLLGKITKYYEPWNSDQNYYWCSGKLDLESGEPVLVSLNDKEFKQAYQNNTTSYEGAKSASFALVDANPTADDQKEALMNGQTPWIDNKNASAFTNGSALEGYTVSIALSDPNGLPAEGDQATDNSGLKTQAGPGPENGPEPPAPHLQPGEGGPQGSASNSTSFVFKQNASQSNYWEGTTVISASSIFGALAVNALDEFAVVAKNLITTDHIEGNVRVAQFTISGGNNSSANLNEGQRMLAQNTVSSVTIEKTIVGSGDGTFQFGFYVGGSKVGSSVSITTENGSGSVTLTAANAKDLFDLLNAGGQCAVYELDEAGNKVEEGGKLGNYTVSYSYGETGSALATSNLDNFFGRIVTTGTNGVDKHFFRPDGLQNTNYFGQEPTERDGALFIGDNFRINGTGKTSEYVYIDGLENTINSDVDSVSTLSSRLANAKNGDAGATQSDVNVINLRSTTNNLAGDLDAAGFFAGGDGNPGVIKGIVKSGQPLLINIDLTGKDSYSINGQSIYYDGKNPQGDEGYSELGALVVYNFVTQDGSGYKPYTGEIIVSNWSTGLLLAPGADVKQNAYWVGEIIANTVTHGGSEIHKKTTVKSRDRAITVAVQNEGDDQGKGSLKIKKNVTLNGNPTGSSEVDGTYEFTVQKSGDNQNVRTVSITIENGQSKTAVVDDLEPGDYVVKEKVNSNPSGVQLTSGNDITVRVDANNAASVPTAEFTNNKAKGSITFEGHKSLTGRAMTAEDTYSFEVKEGDRVVATVTNDADGNIAYPTINYTQADVGEHHYTVREVSANGNGVTVDTTIYNVTVNVTANANGTLSVVASENANSLDFANSYNAVGSTTLSGTKTLVGRDFKEGDKYTFTVTASAGAPMPKKDGQEVTSVTIEPTEGTQASIDFGTISYTLNDVDKTYTYTVTESGTVAGVTNDTATHTMTVTVRDPNKNGQLQVERTYSDGGGLRFTNTYKAQGSVTFTGKKTLEGQAISTTNARSFTYEILDPQKLDENDEPTVVGYGFTNADGSILFDALTYYLDPTAEVNDLGNHTYTVRELIPGGAEQVKTGKWAGKWKNGCYLYDGTNHTVVVNVADKGDGTLNASVVSVDGAENKKTADFANGYEASGEVVIFATKELTGRALAEGEFSFALKDESGNVLQTVANDEHGGITFAPINYTLDDLTRNEDGTYAETTKTYTVSEVVPEDATMTDADGVTVAYKDATDEQRQAGGFSKAGVTYSSAVKTFTVTIVDNTNGALAATPSCADTTSMITNDYNAEGSATIEVTKSYDNWSEANEFSFEITAAAEGAPMPEKRTVTVNTSARSVSFGDIKFTTSDLEGGSMVGGKLTKTFTYTVQEVAPAQEYDGITYDDTPRTVTITATDEGDGTISTTQTATKVGGEAAPADEAAAEEASVPEEESPLTFKNTYNATGSVTFQGKKSMKDRELKEGDRFDFTIVQCDATGTPLKDLQGYEGGAYEGTATATDADGIIKYPTIEYTREKDMSNGDETYALTKTFYYLVTEVVPGDAEKTLPDGTTVEYRDATDAQKQEGGFSKNGVAYASTPKMITVVVTDDGKGTLNAEATEGTNAAVTANADTNNPEASGHFDEASRSAKGLYKTATNLNGEYESTVRIKLQGEAAPVPPPEPQKKTYDIVFVVDKSLSQNTSATELANRMIAEAEAGNYNVRIGIVAFFAVARVVRHLDPNDTRPVWDGSSKPYWGKVKGTNLPAGILLGTKLLDDDKSVVDPKDKYLVVVSDGDTHIYQKDNVLRLDPNDSVMSTSPDDAMVVTQVSSNYNNGAPFAGPGAYSYKYHDGKDAPDGFEPPAKWSEYFQTVGALVEKDEKSEPSHPHEAVWNKDGRNYNYSSAYGYDETKAISEETILDNANTVDTSLYYSLVNYRAASKDYGFNTYAVLAKGNYQRIHGESFMGYLNGNEALDLSALESTLNEELASGATQVAKGGVIEDTIGYGKDNKGNDYDIDFVNDIETTDIILNGRALSKRVNTADGTFEFGEGKNGDPLFTLTYTGKATPGTEGYTVQFSDEVLATDTVEMRYDVRLANPQKESGTYGNYVETGDPEGIEGLLVSSGATFTRANTTQAFAKPVVSYSALGFENTYTASGSATVGGTKKLEGRDFKSGDSITFTLAAGENTPAIAEDKSTVTIAPTAGNSYDFAFPEIPYTLSDAGKTYTYTMTEQATIDGVTNDAYEHTVTVVVGTDKGDGTLNPCTVTYGGVGGNTFTNVYRATGSTTIEGTKVMTGREFKAGDSFTFTLTGPEGAPLPDTTEVTVTPTEGNEIAFDFGTINYTLNDVGKTYTYTVTESGTAAGVTNDADTHTVTVAVEDLNRNGQLQVTRTYSDGKQLAFKNSYTASGDTTLKAKKHYTGAGDFPAGLFQFELVSLSKDENQQVVQTRLQTKGITANDETVSFDTINYSAAGTYYYAIKEIIPVGAEDLGNSRWYNAGYNYDARAAIVKVVVTDNNEGQLIAKNYYKVLDGVSDYETDEGYVENVNDNAIPEFENRAEVKGSAQLTVNKELTGRGLNEGESYSFELLTRAADGVESLLQEGITAPNGTVVFDPIDYTEPGEYTYYIREVQPSGEGVTQKDGKNVKNGVTYDNHEVTANVSVAWGTENGERKLLATVTYEGGATFHNAYNSAAELPLSGTKTLENREFTDGDTLTFTVAADAELNNSAPPLPTTTSVTITPKSGTTAGIDFGKISYNQGDKNKTYYYTVTESANMGGVSSAPVVHKFHVDVVDDGLGNLTATRTDDTEGVEDALSFTNVYNASGSTTIQGTKVMAGREFKAGDSFTFTLTGPEGAPMPETTTVAVTPTASSSVSFGFGTIEYTLADVGKTYTYTVTESGTVAGVTNDADTHTVTIAVEDLKNGQLQVTRTYSDGDQLTFTNTYAPSADIELIATKTLMGRILENGVYQDVPTPRQVKDKEFEFQLLEKGAVLATAKNNETGMVRFARHYGINDVGDHTYTIREVVPTDDAQKSPGILYTAAEQTFTVHVRESNGTLVVSYDDYDSEHGVVLTNTYITSGKATFTANKKLDGNNPAENAYEFQLLNASNEVVARASNGTDGTVVFPEQTFDHPGTYEYTIVETLPQGAQQLGPNWVYDNVAYDRGVSHATVVATDDGRGHLDCVVTYDGGSQKVFNNSTVPDASFTLNITKVMDGRAFKAGDKFTFTVTGSEGAPMPAQTTVEVNPTEGTSVVQSFGNILFNANDLGKTYTYTISEAALPGDTKGVTNDPFSHTVAVTIGANDDGTLSVSPVYDNGDAEELIFTNTYEASGQAQLFAQKTLNGRKMVDGEFHFTLTGGNPAITLHASATADGRAEFDPITYTQADAGNTYTYTITEDPGKLPHVTYDTTEQTVTVHVADNGDGTLAVTYDDNKTEFAGAAFTNTYTPDKAKIVLKAQKTLSGSAITEGQFEFTLKETPETDESLVETASNATDGTVAFTEIEYDEEGTHEYEIKEVVPPGAEDNHDGTFTKDNIVYDGRAHKVVVIVEDNGVGALVATATYDGYTALTITNAVQLAHTGFKFDKYLYGAEGGTFDFTLKAVDANGEDRTGETMDIADGAEIVDNGTSFFTLKAQNGTFGDDKKAEVVFPEISYAADGDYYYLVYEEESSNDNIIADEAKYLIHVVVSNYKVTDTIYNLIYDGQDFGATDDHSFYNNAKVKLGFNSLSAQSYNSDAKRVSVYPKAQKLLNEGTDLLVGNEFQFELIDAASGTTIATATNDENGIVAFYDENVDPGLVYDEPGSYTYLIREVAGDTAGITYDDSVITLYVNVSKDDTGALVAETLYNGPAGLEGDASKPAFHNTKEGMDIRVQKVSRYGGEGLAGCTYGLWMVGENGDVLVQEAVSDAQGYITFRDVSLVQGAKYYFKEVKAPSGHTVDPYRTAYFALNESGDALALVEKTASDGWHSATENIEIDKAASEAN